MSTQKEFIKEQLALNVGGVDVNVAAIHRSGGREPIVFLHGFGSTKEDYADIVRHAAFAGHPFVAYDAPGCGETYCADLSKISIPFLLETALEVLDRLDIGRFHLVGHSMGGLTALMLAHHQQTEYSALSISKAILPPRTASSADRSSIIRKQMPSASLMTSSNVHVMPLPMPAHCMRPACSTRCAPVP